MDKLIHGRSGDGRDAILKGSQYNWKPYTPFRKDYIWTAGICGDSRYGMQNHKRGGKYYYGGKKVAWYASGDVVDFEVDIIAHHNGYFMFYLCDLDKCGTPDIEAKCFSEGHCRMLRRAWDGSCQSGNDLKCGPIDERYPGRFYLPCPQGPTDRRGEHLVGGKSGKMKYKIPDDVSCRNCVIQWYWVTGNYCNTQGYVEYFQGKNKPNWPKCPGQNWSLGGYNAKLAPCRGRNGPEQYWGCADVSIHRKQRPRYG